jgi:hypothetical protein
MAGATTPDALVSQVHLTLQVAEAVAALHQLANYTQFVPPLHHLT